MGAKLLKAFLCTILTSVYCATATAEEQPQRPSGPVGQPPPSPKEEDVIEDVAALFDERGVLTAKGTFILEPSFQFVHNSSTRVAIEGFTIIPAIAIGLININEAQRNTLTVALAGRYGLTNRLEFEAKIPFVYREEDVKTRPILDSTPTTILDDSDGAGLGDIAFALHYQINKGLNGWPFFIANVRVKTQTGEGPFDVDQRITTDDDGERISTILKDQPTGSGFWGIQPSLTVIYPTEPAVLFANVSYLWNLESEIDDLGTVDPGDALGFSFGMGFAINETTSFSLGYDHSVLFKTDIENDTGIDEEFDTIQVGTFQLGLAYQLTNRSSFNLSLGIGVTDDSPDVQIAIRAPMSF